MIYDNRKWNEHWRRSPAPRITTIVKFVWADPWNVNNHTEHHIYSCIGLSGREYFDAHVVTACLGENTKN